MKTQHISVLVVSVLLLGFGVAWGLGYLTEDPEVAQIIKDAEEAFETEQEPSEERRAEFRQRMQGMTPEQQQQAWKAMQPLMMQMMKRQMEQFFAGTPQEQKERISGFADMIVQRRAEQRKREAQQMSNNPGQAGSGPAGPGGPGGPGGRERWQNMTEDERNERMKKMLDMMPAENRALFTQGISMLNEELKSRGEKPVF